MADYGDFVFRVAEGSDIIRVYAGALVQVYESGTDTLVAEITADNEGNWHVPSLAIGKYDIKVDGQLRRTIHHVPADHVHTPDEIWSLFKSGAITGDQDESNTMQIFGTDVAGSIIKVKLIAQYVDATGDVTVHLLKGAVNGSSAMTLGANSVWNHRVYPTSEKYRYQHVDNTPGITLAADDCLTVGLDHAANAVEGLTVLVIFRPE